jgi:hypothetical protein
MALEFEQKKTIFVKWTVACQFSLLTPLPPRWVHCLNLCSSISTDPALLLASFQHNLTSNPGKLHSWTPPPPPVQLIPVLHAMPHLRELALRGCPLLTDAVLLAAPALDRLRLVCCDRLTGGWGGCAGWGGWVGRGRMCSCKAWLARAYPSAFELTHPTQTLPAPGSTLHTLRTLRDLSVLSCPLLEGSSWGQLS